MRPLLSRQQMQAIEGRLMAQGMPGLLLMENAGRGAAHLIGLLLKPRVEASAKASAVRGSCIRCADEAALSGAEVVVLAGPGNNGGDGFVVARHLLGRGARVLVLAWTGAGQTGDAAHAFAAFRAVQGSCAELDEQSLRDALASGPLVVDALFGIGLSRPLDERLGRLVDLVNESGLPVVALDLPTGLDADDGRVWGPCVRATHTVCFGQLKAGLLTTNGHELAGRITLSHIGAKATLEAGELPRAWLLEETDLRLQVTPRGPTAHKGKAGRVAVVGGKPGMVGAPLLAGRAALRAGAGLCTLVSDVVSARGFEREAWELMSLGVEPGEPAAAREIFGHADALVLGPGLGRSELAEELTRLVLDADKPTLVDADGLRLLAADWSRARAHGALVLTPHPGEAAELLGRETRAVEADRFGALQALVELSGAVVVLKGSRTLIGAPGRVPWVSAWGSPALATAGSGDVLAGTIAACMAGEAALAPHEAAALGVGLHGLAGELWAREQGDAGLLASELADWLPRARAALLER